MDFYKLVTDARTCRRFDHGKKLDTGFLNWLIDCARITPSASNAQVLRYVTVEDEKRCASMYKALGWAGALKDWGGPTEEERPVGYIIFYGPTEKGGISTHTAMDTGIAAQTMQLAATSKNAAVCMFRSFNPRAIQNIFPTPEGCEIALVLAVGYGVEERRLTPLPEDGSIKYWRDANKVHYVPKRALKDIILASL